MKTHTAVETSNSFAILGSSTESKTFTQMIEEVQMELAGVEDNQISEKDKTDKEMMKSLTSDSS